jgi:hypothetical protein
MLTPLLAVILAQSAALLPAATERTYGASLGNYIYVSGEAVGASGHMEWLKHGRSRALSVRTFVTEGALGFDVSSLHRTRSGPVRPHIAIGAAGVFAPDVAAAGLQLGLGATVRIAPRVGLRVDQVTRIYVTSGGAGVASLEIGVTTLPSWW